MAAADQLPGGIFNEICIKLAELAACAVDFAKTGVAPNLDSVGWKVEKYPDFMNKKDKPFYKSTKVSRERR